MTSAVVCEDPSAVPGGVAMARVACTAAAAGPIAQAFHGWPARKLTLIAVTGTKGKIVKFQVRPDPLAR